MNNLVFLDNIVFWLQKAGGISVYWSEIVKRAMVSDRFSFFEPVSRGIGNIFHANLDISEGKIQREACPVSFLRYLPLTKKIPKGSIFHSSYFRFAVGTSAKNVVTVHDLTYEILRSGTPKFVHRIQKGIALMKAAGILCVSENTKKDLIHFYPWTVNKPMKVVYNGINEIFQPNMSSFVNLSLACLNGKKYYLFVGARDFHKNFWIAVEALTKMSNSVLAAVGGGKLSDREKIKIDQKLPGRFYHFDCLPVEDLCRLYSKAYCLLYPSSYEGFGIPIAEAMASGCPVISCKNSSIPEVAGNAAILVDSPTEENLFNALVKIENQSVRQKLVQLGLVQARKFSWEKCVNEIFAFYELISKV